MQAKEEFERRFTEGKAKLQHEDEVLRTAAKQTYEQEQQKIKVVADNNARFEAAVAQRKLLISPVITATSALLADANLILTASESSWKDRDAASIAIDFTKDLERLNYLYSQGRMDLRTYKEDVSSMVEETSKNVKESGKLVMALANILSCVLTLGAAVIYRLATGSWFFNANNPSPKITDLQNKVEAFGPKTTAITV